MGSVEATILAIATVALGFAFGWLLTVRAGRKALESRISELSDARAFSEAIIENTPDGFIVCDDQFTVVQVNDAFSRMSGYSKDDWVGAMPPYPGWPEDELPRIREHMQKMERGEFVPIEFWYERRDGTRFPIVASPGQIRTRRGKTYYFAIIKDVSEQRAYEDKLKQSEEMFRRITETSTDAIYQLDNEGQITYCSPAVTRILGYQQDEFIGTNFRDHIFAEDLPKVMEGFKAVRMGGETKALVFRIFNKNKIPVDLELNATPIWKDGEIVGSQGMARDVTNRKKIQDALRESEARFKAQYKELPIPVYTWQRRGEDFFLTDFNLAAEKITSGQIGKMLGITASKLFEDQPSIVEQMNQCFDERRSFTTDVLYNFKTTGESKYLIVSYAYVKPDIVLVHTEDVTARTIAEERLRESEAWFRTAVESIPFDFYLLDEDRRCVMQNTSSKNRWGDITGKRPEEAGLDAAVTRAWTENVEKALGGEQVEEESSVVFDGKEQVFFNTVTPVFDGDRVDGIVGVTIDITERKHAEEALRRSEERLRSIISVTPNVAIEGYTADGEVLFWNRAAEEMFGWKSNEVVGKPLDGLILDKKGAADFRAALEEIARTGEPYGPGEWAFTRRDGSKGTAYSTIFSIPFGEGRREYICMDVDISLRKEAEKALKESEEKYRFLIENTGTPVTFWDTDGRLLLMNEVGAANLGATAEDLVGKHFSDIFPEERAEEFQERNRKVIETRVGTQYEDSLEILGRERTYRSVLQPVTDAADNIIGVQIVSHDTTELLEADRLRREADERLRLIVGQIPAILWTTDTDLKFTSSMGAGLEALGLEKGEVVGMSLYEFFGTDDPEFYPIAMHRRSLEGEPTLYETNWGDATWETHTEPLRDSNDDIIGCLAIALNVTDRKQAEKEIRESQMQLRALALRVHEAREEESASIAREIHDELGQILMGIKMDLKWIERRLGQCDQEGERAELEKKIALMNEEIDSSARSVRKIAAQLRPMILDDLGLIGAIEWQSQEFQDRTEVACRIKEHHLEEIDLGLVPEQSTAVFRIFQEILTNVGRHSGARNVEVELRIEDDRFFLEVTDDGKGFPENELRRSEGLGILGMRERAHVFGGKVSISNADGGGTRVQVLIPLGES
jgi:PAS domain S-box-containing protein